MIGFVLSFDASSIVIGVVGFGFVTAVGIAISFINNLIKNNKELITSITKLSTTMEDLTTNIKRMEDRIDRLEAPHFK